MTDLAALEAAATPGPWKWVGTGSEGGTILAENARLTPLGLKDRRVARLTAANPENDGPLIAAMRNALPRLLRIEAAARELQDALDERPPEGPDPTTIEVEQWYIRSDQRIRNARAALRDAIEDKP